MPSTVFFKGSKAILTEGLAVQADAGLAVQADAPSAPSRVRIGALPLVGGLIVQVSALCHRESAVVALPLVRD